MAGSSDSETRSSATGGGLGDALATLKQRGCGLLVTGPVRPEVAQLVSQRLFGDPSRARTRVLVAADGSSSGLSRYLPMGISLSHSNLHVIALGADERGTATARSPEVQADDGVEVETLDDLLDGLPAYLRKDYRRARTPGHVRVGLIGLRHLFDARPDADVREFVAEVTEQVRSLRGMVHYHLRLPDDHDLVTDLDAVVDARIELRTTPDSSPEHRWHLPDYGTSEWLSFREMRR